MKGFLATILAVLAGTAAMFVVGVALLAVLVQIFGERGPNWVVYFGMGVLLSTFAMVTASTKRALKRRFTASALITISVLAALSTQRSPAQQADPNQTVDQLLRSTMENIARQRAEARRLETEKRASEDLPDLSKEGTLVEQPTEQPPMVSKRRRPILHCTTMSMGGGDSATDCF